ncbi:MAG TPA: hypothetical protein PLD77_02200 [Candidatus Dojkabacteria bacterium]|nr:hypothetical protein [Candidatus Dojkabacteria bacterium]
MVVTESELENNEVFSKIKALKLEPDEFLIIGSGIMFALGIRSLDDIHDIDIIVNEKGWEKVKNLSKVYTNELGEKHLYLLGKRIEVWDTKNSPKYDFNDLHKRAYFVGKYPFLSPEDTIRYKKRMRRKKDFKHIQMIEKYLAKKY